jgi:DNA-binding transcriptional ArsR family regulator
MASSPTDSGGREESRGAGSSTDTACVTLDAACTPPEKALSPRVWMPRTAARVAAVMDSNSAQTPTDHREREAPDVVLNITPPSRARSDQRLINNRGTSLKNCPKTLDIEATSCDHLRMHEDTHQEELHPDDAFVELAVEVFSMLADATRVRMILALRDEELSVNHLADIVDKSPTAVSQHLAKLRMARMVSTRQAGNRVFYRLVNDHASKLVQDAIFQAEHSVGAAYRHHHEGH